MDLAQTVTNAIVVGAVGIVLGFLVHGLRGEIRDLRAEVRQDIGSLRGEIGALRTEVRHDIADLRRELGEMRSDLMQVALSVGTRPRTTRNP